ncbi:thioredoxin b [Stigmatopora argus]
MVKSIENIEEFRNILKGSGSKLVVVDFTATWCGPCKMIGPKFEEASKKYTNVVFLKVDVDDCDDVTQEYGISCMPTFLFFKNGEKIDTLTGANESQLLAKIEKNAN